MNMKTFQSYLSRKDFEQNRIGPIYEDMQGCSCVLELETLERLPELQKAFSQVIILNPITNTTCTFVISVCLNSKDLLNVDQINDALQDFGINIIPQKGLWASSRDGRAVLNDENQWMDAVFLSKTDVQQFAKEWAKAVNYFGDENE